MERKTRRKEWEERLKGWKDSGLSQKAYCEREGISFTSLRYWSAQVFREQKAELTLVSVRMPEGVGDLVIRGPRGWQCVFPAGTPASWVAEVLRAL